MPTVPQLERVDAVVDGLCLHKVVGEDRARFLQVLRHLIRPGGAVLLMTMFGLLGGPTLQAGYDRHSGTVSFQGRAELHLGQSGDLLAEVHRAGLLVEAAHVVAGNDWTDDRDMLLYLARAAGPEPGC